MDNGVDRGAGHAEARRAWAKDALGAIAIAEGSFTERVFVAMADPLPLPGRSAFGEPVAVERGESARVLAPRFLEAIESGQRATLIATARDLTSARDFLLAIRARRIGTVVHAIAGNGSNPGDALALGELGWGVLFSAGVEEALDLSLVARRAAEDSGTPFFVVHERGAARHVEAVVSPSRELVEVFVGSPRSRIRPVGDPAHPVHVHVSERAFAERVPFALGSAMRELESLTGRRKDVLERIPAGDAPVVMVAMGELGEAVIAGVERLRMQGQEVGAIKLTAFRPFPGARLVKAMQRALAITVLETVDDPLAQSGPLTREVKAAFADAMSWAPDYPGIGRIPRIASGLVTRELDAQELDAVAHNMNVDERGKRTFVLGGDPGHSLAGAPPPAKAVPLAHAISMRGRVRDAATAEACAELCAAVVSSALGLHVRASVRRLRADSPSGSEGDGYAFDLLASRDRPRGVHAPHAVRLIAVEDATMLSGPSPLARLGDEGILAVPTQQRSADAVWAEIPAYVKAIVFDRRAHVVGWVPPEESDPKTRSWLVAAAFGGLALASAAGRTGRAPVDGSLVAREVAEALRAALGPAGEEIVTRGAEVARRAFEAHVVVPRATVERDEESIRLGRRDVRASQPPR
jgi:pyruvate-ferredoxin/flavodoxin oxidoreductase